MHALRVASLTLAFADNTGTVPFHRKVARKDDGRIFLVQMRLAGPNTARLLIQSPLPRLVIVFDRPGVARVFRDAFYCIVSRSRAIHRYFICLASIIFHLSRGRPRE